MISQKLIVLTILAAVTLNFTSYAKRLASNQDNKMFALQAQESDNQTPEEVMVLLKDPARTLRMIDGDSDGELTLREFSDFFVHMANLTHEESPRPEDVRKTFEMVDHDHDGKISLDEFKQLTDALLLSIQHAAENAQGSEPTSDQSSFLQSRSQSSLSNAWRYFGTNTYYPDGTWVFFGNWGTDSSYSPWYDCWANCPRKAVNEGKAFDGSNYICIRHNDTRTDRGSIANTFVLWANPVRCYYQRSSTAASSHSEIRYNHNMNYYYSDNPCKSNERTIQEGLSYWKICIVKTISYL